MSVVAGAFTPGLMEQHMLRGWPWAGQWMGPRVERATPWLPELLEVDVQRHYLCLVSSKEAMSLGLWCHLPRGGLLTEPMEAERFLGTDESYLGREGGKGSSGRGAAREKAQRHRMRGGFATARIYFLRVEGLGCSTEASSKRPEILGSSAEANEELLEGVN